MNLGSSSSVPERQPQHPVAFTGLSNLKASAGDCVLGRAACKSASNLMLSPTNHCPPATSLGGSRRPWAFPGPFFECHTFTSPAQTWLAPRIWETPYKPPLARFPASESCAWDHSKVKYRPRLASGCALPKTPKEDGNAGFGLLLVTAMGALLVVEAWLPALLVVEVCLPAFGGAVDGDCGGARSSSASLVLAPRPSEAKVVDMPSGTWLASGALRSWPSCLRASDAKTRPWLSNVGAAVVPFSE
mmetsp:Transcript_71257/g.204429  ORF Transcript_71257/g.204429 Transcript_71257/m.204429 type:complete len:245 (+) Transcript_71257:1012-1746(+)